MKISISNIAWDKKDDERVYDILYENRIYGVDVAPARVFEHPFNITNLQGQEFIKGIGIKELVPVGMQSLLYGTEGLQLFENEEKSTQTIEHLKKIMDYAKKIGITRVVFGSPKNRLINNMSKREIEYKSEVIFNELGDYAMSKDLYFCIEPNPTLYGADYITSTLEGVELVKKINNPGFRLHLDLGTILINNENMEEVVAEAAPITQHVHLSHPNLEQVIGNEKQHTIFRDLLKKYNYTGVVAIEMKNSMSIDNVERVKESIEFISSIYGGD
ncbi:MAG: TIM barrel protein [Clostridiales bacterium]|nr:TIM barrel protein [Clostridiales bacterium]